MAHTADRPNPRSNTADTHRSATPAGRPVPFWFEGRMLQGFEGESVAKALFRNGIRTLSRSVKYGRPRGIHCGRGRCIMCHVEIDGVSGVKSCLTPLAEGMRVNRQDYKPFYARAFTAVLRRVSFPAGFYYRMFTRPRWVRGAFLGTIRRLAGVGRIETGVPSPRRLDPPPGDLSALRERYGVAVVGAGVSGLAAALAAVDAGADVLLVDEYAAPGGHTVGRLADTALSSTRDELVQRIADAGDARLAIVAGTTAQGFYEPGRLLLGREAARGEGGGLRVVTADAFVFATGANDLVPLFENNDLPGVFGARGLRLFLERDGLVPGRRAVVYGTGPALSGVAALLQSWGVAIEAVADPSEESPAAGEPTVSPGGFRTLSGAKLVAAEGREWVERAVFDAGPRGRESFPCDILCIADFGQPSLELAQQAGFDFELRGVDGREDFKVMLPTADVVDDGAGTRRFLVGEASGRFDWREKIRHAAAAGAAAACKTTQDRRIRS